MNGCYEKPSLAGNSASSVPRIDYLPNVDTAGLKGAGTIRYNPATAKLEASNNGGGFFEIGAAGSGIQSINAGNNITVSGSGSSTTVSTVTNPTFSGKTTLANGRLAIDNSYDGTSATLTTPSGNPVVIQNSDGAAVAFNGSTIYTKYISAINPPGGPIVLSDATTVSGALTASAGVSVTGDIAVSGLVDGRDVSADGAKTDTMYGFLNQSVKTTANPTFAGMALTGPVTTTSTIAGRNIALDGGQLDTLSILVGQDLRPSATPTFSGLSVTGNVSVTGTVDGRDVSTDGIALDLVTGRVNQGVRTSDAPTFAGATINGNVAVTGTVDGRDVSVDGAALDTVVGRVNQDLKSTASPTFVGLTTSGQGTFNKLKASTYPILGGTSTSSSGFYFMSLTYAMATNESKYIAFGQDVSSGNQAELGFTWAGAGSTSNSMTLGFYGNQVMTLVNNGNVGIGGTPGAFKLDVAGTGRFTGALTATTINPPTSTNLTFTNPNTGNNNQNFIFKAGTDATNTVSISPWSDGNIMTFGGTGSNRIRANINGTANTEFITIGSATGAVYNYAVVGTSGQAVSGGLRMSGTSLQYHNGSAWNTLGTSSLAVWSGTINVNCSVGSSSIGTVTVISGPTPTVTGWGDTFDIDWGANSTAGKKVVYSVEYSLAPPDKYFSGVQHAAGTQFTGIKPIMYSASPSWANISVAGTIVIQVGYLVI